MRSQASRMPGRSSPGQAALDHRAILPFDENARPAHRRQSTSNRRAAHEAGCHRRQSRSHGHPVGSGQWRQREVAANVAFFPDEIALLDAINKRLQGKTALQTNPYRSNTLAWAAWIIARFGGWTGYASHR